MSQCTQYIIFVTRYEPRKDLAKNLNDLDIYCSEKLREYLEDKDEQNLLRLRTLFQAY